MNKKVFLNNYLNEKKQLNGNEINSNNNNNNNNNNSNNNSNNNNINKEKDKDRERNKDKERIKERNDKERDRDREKERGDKERKKEKVEKPQVAVLKQSAQHVKLQRLKEKEKEKEKSKEKEREKAKDREKVKDREKEKERDRLKQKDIKIKDVEKEKVRDKEKEREREKIRDKEKDRSKDIVNNIKTKEKKEESIAKTQKNITIKENGNITSSSSSINNNNNKIINKTVVANGNGSSSISSNNTNNSNGMNGSNDVDIKKKPILESKKRALPSSSKSITTSTSTSTSTSKLSKPVVKKKKDSNLKKIKLSNGGVVTKYKRKKSSSSNSDSSSGSSDDSSDDSSVNESSSGTDDSDNSGSDESSDSSGSDDSSDDNSTSDGSSGSDEEEEDDDDVEDDDSSSFDSNYSGSSDSFSDSSECDDSDCSCGKKRKNKLDSTSNNKLTKKLITNGNTDNIDNGLTTSSIVVDEQQKITTDYIEKHLNSGKANPDYSDIAVLIQKSRNKKFGFISRNFFIERTEKILYEIDDIDICNCSKSSGSVCGEDCLNRESYVECNSEHCELGKKCTNQRFQRKQYSNIKPAFTGKKGWGLIANEDIEEKQFIMEYCGEVISKQTCLRRMKEAENEKFFYFLTLDAKECLDASKRGNLARFMNHSCDPNCETQKWTVGGEVKIGIFAIKPIPKGTELTFDYNYERFGAQKQECYCGSVNCRGYLGQKSKSSTSTTRPKQITRWKNSIVLNHNHHVKYFLGEPIIPPSSSSSSSSFRSVSALYNSELSPEMELQLINSKRIFLHRNVRKLKSFYLNVFNYYSNNGSGSNPSNKKLINITTTSTSNQKLKRKNKISDIFNV
ncbi:hypothetical protein ACTFIV_001147 [Dictyostelium citrinum]